MWKVFLKSGESIDTGCNYFCIINTTTIEFSSKTLEEYKTKYIFNINEMTHSEFIKEKK